MPCFLINIYIFKHHIPAAQPVVKDMDERCKKCGVHSWSIRHVVGGNSVTMATCNITL